MADDKTKDQEQDDQQEEETERKVGIDEVVGVLAKHAPVPSDPDDADLLGRYNTQVSEERTAQADQQTAEDKSETDQDEGPQGGSPPRGSPTARTGADKPQGSAGTRREKP